MPNFSGLPLHTKRLLLRPLAATDAAALLAIFSDGEVMRYWSTPPWTSMEQAQAFIERDHKGLETGQHLRLGIVKQVDGALIGQCTLFGIIPSCRRAELGYSLARSTWGNGYANEALKALVRYGFDNLNLNLNRIEADIDPWS
jgi:[ribosomal protein S5]-alanine N-acetyltransferase